MRYLVTGGAGFIGAHLAEFLLAKQQEIVLLDPVWPPMHLKDHWFPGSVLDPAALRQAVAGCDGIFHLAAVVGFARVMQDPVRTILTNTMGTDCVLRCALEAEIPVLLTSTSAVYGRASNGGLPVAEDMDCHLGPTTTTSWCYAYAKAADEVLALAYAHTARLPVVIARLFNTVGPRQSAEAGFVLPRFVEAALAGRPLEVHRPGTQRRTFVHVRDVVRALVELLDCPQARGQVVNVGGTATMSIEALAQLVIHETVSPSGYVIVDPPYESYDNVSDRRPDLTKLEGLLGWIPGMPLTKMIQDVAMDAHALR